MRTAPTRARHAWEEFWFAPMDAATLGLVRIAFGFVVFLWTLSMAPDLGAFFSSHGLVGDAAPAREWWQWTLLDADRSEYAVAALWVALMLASLGVLAGWHARVSSAVVFVALTSLERATPYVFNSGDTLLRLAALYLMLAPAGAAFSLDHRRGAGAITSHPRWSIRLMQIQVTVMYVSTVWSKLHGSAWIDGTAVSYSLRLPDVARFPAPDILASSAIAGQIATYGTILVEAGVAVLIWCPRTRTAALLAGVALHVCIDITLRVGFFSLAVLVFYLSFLDPERVRAMAATVARHASAARVQLTFPWSPSAAARPPEK